MLERESQRAVERPNGTAEQMTERFETMPFVLIEKCGCFLGSILCKAFCCLKQIGSKVKFNIASSSFAAVVVGRFETCESDILKPFAKNASLPVSARP